MLLAKMIHIERLNNHIILQLNWIVETLEDRLAAIMLQVNEEVDHRGALKECKIFHKLELV
jgi:hypothetical protein